MVICLQAKFAASLYWLVFRATEDGEFENIPSQVTSPIQRDLEVHNYYAVSQMRQYYISLNTQIIKIHKGFNTSHIEGGSSKL